MRSHKQNFNLPQEMRRVADIHDISEADWLQPVSAKAGDCILFTEALMHATMPWRLADAKRRTLFYKF
eukprot:SAG11_NODE_7137_length_1188_cov_2.129477_1_plen_67_part_10